MYRRGLIRSAVTTAGLAMLPATLPETGRGQSFPSRQLRILVPAAAGGGTDLVARVVAQELGKSGGLSTVVDNKPGGAGAIAVRETLRAAPDGHTLLVANVGQLAVVPYAMKDAGYNPPTDIAPVCLAVDFSNVLVVHPSVAAKTLGEYLDLARRPEGIEYGTSGVGSAGHLAGLLLQARSNARLNHVPFRGGGPAMNDLVAGHLPSMIASAPTAGAFVREGRIRGLALTGAERTQFDPDLPTIAQSGFPGYAATNWYAFVVSSKVPRDIVGSLNALLTRALDAAEVRAAFAQQGMVTLGGTAEQAAAHIAHETEVWSKVIADAGIRLE
jgi:tripartite-type tricarboxylate transporter receptor subunit TctC